MRKIVFTLGVLGGSLVLVLVLVFGVFRAWHSHSARANRAQQGVGAGFKPAPTRTAMPAAKGISSLPLEAQASISGALGRDLPAYHAVAAISDRRSDSAAMSSSPVGGQRPPLQGASFAARNARNKLAAGFTPQGVTVRSGTARWKMALAGYGYSNDLKAVAATAPTAKANRVEYPRGALTEWYVNGPMGLEQGFTLSKPPTGRGTACRTLNGSAACRTLDDSTDAQRVGQALPLRAGGGGGPLTIALTLAGDLTAKMDPNGKGLTLSGPSPHTSPNASPRPSLRYAGLTATDATGKELPASLELRGQELLLKVNDADARYPVVIDPFVQLAELTASDGAGLDELGYSVAVSGKTAVAGALGSNSNAGAVYVFVEPSTGWANMTQTAKLTASDAASDAFLGCSVAISGNTVAAGARGASVGGNVDQGAAYVFVEPPTGWTDMTETAKLISSEGAKDDNFGTSVAIAAGAVVAGAPQEYTGPGAAYLFVQPLGGWKTTSRFKAKLTASDGVGTDDELGASVGISGGTVVAVAPRKTAVYVFVRPATGWTSMTQTAELTAPLQGSGDLGNSVAISGSTVVAGSPGASGGVGERDSGAADIFVEPATGWVNMTPTAVLTASDRTENSQLGVSVAVSGKIVVAGAPGAAVGRNAGQGAAYVFIEPASGWVNMTQTGKLTNSSGQRDEQFGWSVALLGSTAVVGVPNMNAAYVFGKTQ